MIIWYSTMKLSTTILQNKYTLMRLGGLLLAFVLGFSMPTHASGTTEHETGVHVQQKPRKPGCRMDWQELRRKQEAFITQHAGLTQAEANFFFPLFHELKQKQREIRRSMHRIYRGMESGTLTEKQCDEYLLQIGKLQKQSTELEITYYKKWKKKLSASKIIKVLSADRRFSKQVFEGKVK